MMPTNYPLGTGRLHQHVQKLVGTEADLVACQSNDAGVAAAKHLNSRAPDQPEFFQPVDMVRLTDDATYAGRLAGLQPVQGD